MGYLINRGTKKDPVYYGAFKDIDDVWKRKRTGQRTEQAAYKVLEAWEARVAQGLPGIPGESEKRAAAEARQRAEVARKLTVADLARRFLQEYQRPKIRDILSYRQTYGSYIKGGILAAPLAATPAASVRKVDVERWRDTFLSGRYAPSTINNILGILGTIYNWAGEQDLVMVRNPCRGVEDMPALPSQEHYSLEEVHRLLALPECPAAVWCALYTGMRPGELRGLTWPCVHMDAQIPYIDVRRSYRGPTKSGKPRAVPIHPELLPILRQWQNECPVTDEALVFPVEVKGRYRMACDTDRDNLAELLEAAGCHVPQEGRLREAMEAAVLLAFELRRPAFSQPGPDGVWRSPLRDQQLEHRRQKHLETLFGCLELDSSDVADTGLRLPCEAILAFMLDHLSACQRSRSREVAWLARVTAGAQETERLVNRNDRDNPGPVLVTYPDPAFELHALAWRYRIAEEHGDGYSPAQASAEALDRLAMELARWADGLRVQAAAGSDREPGRPEGGTRWLLRQCRGDIDKVQKLYQDKGLPSPSRPTLRRALHRLKIQPVSDET